MEAWTTIRYLQAQGKGIHAIARELGVSRKAVRRALRTEGPPGYQRAKRTNPQIVPYLAQIRELYFSKHLIGTRILREIQAKGYTGGRPPCTATCAGSAAAAVGQGDGALRDRAWPAGAVRLVAVHRRAGRRADQGDGLRHDARVFAEQALHGQPGRDPGVDLRGDRACLRHFGGAAKELLVDNPRAFVPDAKPAHFRWNPQFLELCGHYRIKPRACTPTGRAPRARLSGHSSTWSSSSSRAAASRAWPTSARAGDLRARRPGRARARDDAGAAHRPLRPGTAAPDAITRAALRRHPR